jgi:hypothetical protein
VCAGSHYLVTGQLWEALFENWESEFLQMAVFFVLLTLLIQKVAAPAVRLREMRPSMDVTAQGKTSVGSSGE